ncbi:MAG: PilZ domain-containing protein [Planctomycetes bacterium]|nr:PilZ domain-containing protein [Planctomycetota bacterium]
MRLRIAACVALETLGRRNENNQALGSVRDVSRTGIGIETGQPPLAGQLVKLRIALDDDIQVVTARATRISKSKDPNFLHVGLDWSECSDTELEFLERVFEAAETLHL